MRLKKKQSLDCVDITLFNSKFLTLTELIITLTKIIYQYRIASSNEKPRKCDLSKCATMTQEHCAKMFDSLKCNPEEKQACLSHYGADGKFISDSKMDCCEKDDSRTTYSKKAKMEDLPNGKVRGTYTVTKSSLESVQVFEGTKKEVSDKINAMK